MLFLQADVRGQRKEDGIQEITGKILEKFVSVTENFAPITIDSKKFGREHPFKPLTRPKENIVNSEDIANTQKSENEQPKPQSGIQITAIFAAADSQSGESTAIIAEDGVSRSISVGDIVAEMTVKKILRGKIILCRNNKDYVIQLGVLPAEIQQMANEDK